MKKYITNLSRGCFSHWTASKAVMELVQNWLDSDGERSHSFSDGVLTLTNANIKVSNKLLMMGMSDKRDDDSKRGQFGVGSIQAMVVLIDLGIDVRIYNNDVQWIPMFEYDDKFESDIMVIHEYPITSPDTNFTVEIDGLSDEDDDEIRQRCLEFQDREVLFSTEYGDVIENIDDECGEVFCGDIYVCQNSQFKYSYNFKPKVIKLSQDRDAVSQWDMQKITANLIMATGDVDFIKEALKSGKLDTQLVKYNYATTPSSVDDNLAEEFLEEYGVVAITDDYSEHQINVKLGNKSVYNPNSSVVHSIQQSEVYKKAISQLEVIEKEDFTGLMYDFLSEVKFLLEETTSNVGVVEELLERVIQRVDSQDYE